MNTLWEFSSKGAHELVEKMKYRKLGVEAESTLGHAARAQLTMMMGKLKGPVPYYRAWRCASQMLADQGYNIDDRPFTITFSCFLIHHGLHPRRDPSPDDLDCLQITNSTCQSSSNVKVLFMFFVPDKTVTVDTLRSIYTANRVNPPARVIFVAYAISLPPVYRRAIAAVCPFKVETFHISQLYFNWMRDYLKLRFRTLLLTEETKTALFFKSSEEKIQVKGYSPESLIAQYYALEEGMVLEATNVDRMLQLLQAAEEAAVDG